MSLFKHVGKDVSDVLFDLTIGECANMRSNSLNASSQLYVTLHKKTSKGPNKDCKSKATRPDAKGEVSFHQHILHIRTKLYNTKKNPDFEAKLFTLSIYLKQPRKFGRSKKKSDICLAFGSVDLAHYANLGTEMQASDSVQVSLQHPPIVDRWYQNTGSEPSISLTLKHTVLGSAPTAYVLTTTPQPLNRYGGRTRVPPGSYDSSSPPPTRKGHQRSRSRSLSDVISDVSGSSFQDYSSDDDAHEGKYKSVESDLDDLPGTYRRRRSAEDHKRRKSLSIFGSGRSSRSQTVPIRISGFNEYSTSDSDSTPPQTLGRSAPSTFERISSLSGSHSSTPIQEKRKSLAEILRTSHSLGSNPKKRRGSNREKRRRSEPVRRSFFVPETYTADFNSLWHCLDHVNEQLEIGLDQVKGLSSFFEKISRLHTQYADGIKKLVETEIEEMTDRAYLGGNCMHSMVDAMGMVGEFGKIFARLSSDLHDTVISPLENFYQHGLQNHRSFAERQKLYPHTLQATEDGVRKIKEQTLRAVETLRKNEVKASVPFDWLAAYETQHQPIEGTSPTIRDLALTEKACRHAIQACQNYSDYLERADQQQKRHMQTDYPKLLLELQSFEQMRITSMKNFLSQYISLQDELVGLVDDVGTKMHNIVDRMDVDEEIESFAKRALELYGLPPKIPEFMYDMYYTVDRLERQSAHNCVYIQSHVQAEAQEEIRTGEKKNESLEDLMSEKFAKIGLDGYLDDHNAGAFSERETQLKLKVKEIVKMLHPAVQSEFIENFDDFVVKNTVEEKYFSQYLKRTLCRENLDFYHDCCNFLSFEDDEEEFECIDEIAQQFLQIDSPSQINLPHFIQKGLLKQLLKRDDPELLRSLMREAKEEAVQLMKEHSFPRFQSSQEYLDYLRHLFSKQSQKHLQRTRSKRHKSGSSFSSAVDLVKRGVISK